MSNKFTAPDREKFEAFFAERAQWASLYVPIEEIAKDNKRLIHDLSQYDPTIAIPLLASLLTIPELQSHCIRLEILIALAVVHCNGQKKADIDNAVYWFDEIGKSRCVLGEDPAEDVFVSLVQAKNGDYRLIEGIWEAAGFYTQQVLDVIETMPDTGQFGHIKKSVRALLVISDIVCERAGLHRYQIGSDELHEKISPTIFPELNTLLPRVNIAFSELELYEITPDDIAPFCLQPQMQEDLPKQFIGLSYLDWTPLIVQDTTYFTVVLPSALSVAVRDYVIANIIKGGLTETFDNVLAENYSKLFFDTHLLGKVPRAPVHWMRDGVHRWSNFVLKVDEGYFISFHLFLPSLQTHTEGGFKEVCQDEGSLTEALQSSIEEVVKKFNGESNFKKGLVVLVGCGWGKGYATQYIDFDYPHWRFESMSVADLVRLSWLGNMSPSYFWRIQDGLEAVGKAGIRFVNPNGILNIIGWVRSNDGHLVPHADLPEGEISLERPLIFSPPLNLLREVRADSDQGYDRHSVVDNIGIWHDAKRVSPKPLFTCKSEQRMYASMTDVNRGKLTSVYEGSLKLWVSISTPNITERRIEYRLWEMVREWLHRVGIILDKRDEATTQKHNLKVYVEFQDDNPIERMGQKPCAEDLVSLCKIESCDERNACKAVFQTGFLDGFRIAENVTECLFVRTLVKAYLHLLGVKDCDAETAKIESRVVPNKNARSFHIFHARKFVDYVRDSLPETLIKIDKVDDAAARIGLGWRVLEKDKSSQINGPRACTDFLRKTVDVLLTEIIEMLKTFERLAVLKRLVANCEKASTEKDHWERTSAALLGLHGDEPGTTSHFVKQLSKFAGAAIASRILTEIALCVCPVEGGMMISDIELSKLLSRAALLIRIGGFSDAIFYNALAPNLTISPLGDILFRDEFGQMVVEPMLTREIGERFIAKAPSQIKNYEEPEIVPEIKTRISKEFREIWKEEMGFELDDARNIIDSLEDHAIKDNTAILTINLSTYLKIVCSNIVSTNAAINFFNQFSLITRPCWDQPPKGFELKDIYPWRFGRRLSVVTRPILVTDDHDDPLLIIPLSALREGFVYVFDGAYNGEFDQAFFQTKAMRDTWWGKAHEGHTFNAEAAKSLSDAGWIVRENIELPAILNRKFAMDYGDIDVLAWQTDRKEVLVIECKDLSFARNYSEIAIQLSDYQGVINPDGKPDKLRRHLNRVNLLQDNLDVLQLFTGVIEPLVVSCLLCSGTVPMQYAKVEALAGTKVVGVKDLLNM